MKTIQFENPTNQYVEKIQAPALGAVLLGPLSIGLAGAWGPALIYFLLTILSGGLFWFVLPFLAESILRKYYLGRGWVEIFTAEEKVTDYPLAPVDAYFKPVMAGLVVCSLGLAGAMALFAWVA